MADHVGEDVRPGPARYYERRQRMATRRQELRAEALVLDAGRCVWPGCQPLGLAAPQRTKLEMAHLRGTGMGGRASADQISNVAILCSDHHDLLDGRTHAGLRRELGLLLTGFVAVSRRDRFPSGGPPGYRNPEGSA